MAINSKILAVLATILLCPAARAEPLSEAFGRLSKLTRPECEVKDRVKYCAAVRQKGFSTWTYGDCHEQQSLARLEVADAKRSGAEAEVKTKTEYCVAFRQPGFSTWTYSDCSWSQAEARVSLAMKKRSGSCGP